MTIPELVLPMCHICSKRVEPHIATTDAEGRTVHIACHMLSLIVEAPAKTD
jgi:hypothetical protein